MCQVSRQAYYAAPITSAGCVTLRQDAESPAYYAARRVLWGSAELLVLWLLVAQFVGRADPWNEAARVHRRE